MSVEHCAGWGWVMLQMTQTHAGDRGTCQPWVVPTQSRDEGQMVARDPAPLQSELGENLHSSRGVREAGGVQSPGQINAHASVCLYVMWGGVTLSWFVLST